MFNTNNKLVDNNKSMNLIYLSNTIMWAIIVSLLFLAFYYSSIHIVVIYTKT